MVKSQDIGQILKNMRAGLPKNMRSQEKYAESCGLSTRIINKIEDPGHINVHFNTISKALMPLGINLSRIVEMAESKTREYLPSEEGLKIRNDSSVYNSPEKFRLIEEISVLLNRIPVEELRKIKNIVKAFIDA